MTAFRESSFQWTCFCGAEHDCSVAYESRSARAAITFPKVCEDCGQRIERDDVVETTPNYWNCSPPDMPGDDR